LGRPTSKNGTSSINLPTIGRSAAYIVTHEGTTTHQGRALVISVKSA
jgi:hypothetical protein